MISITKKFSPSVGPAYKCLFQLAALSTFLINVAPSIAAFKPLKIEAMIPCHFKLTRITNIPYQCWRFKDRDAKLSVWEDSIGFSFGQLKKSQWEQIAQAYGTGKEVRPYHPQQKYWLMDFMPPLMQATNRHRFEKETRTISPSRTQPEGKTTVLSNCWGTLYELLRLKNEPARSASYLMMVEPSEMLTTLESISEPIKQPRPGDFLLITHRHGDRIYLDHGALYIDDDLLFEKAGAGDAVPYRLIDRQTLESIWRPDVFDYQVRRPIDTQQMPHPLSFSKNKTRPKTALDHWTVITHDNNHTNKEQYYSIFPLSLSSDAEGKFVLPPKAYTSDYFQRE